MTDLGKLEQITDLKSVWPTEPRDFSPWLARPENLSQLAEAIGFGPDGLELEKTEENVGDFFADIVARDTLGGEGGRVLIENQFGRTNHDHLGKILTYASGLKDVRTIVWIAENFREEHRAALDWLNRNTQTGLSFFAIEIELWRIGASLPAPRFSIVVRPNDWERTALVEGRENISELKQLYVRYWNALGDAVRARRSSLKPQKGHPQQWASFSIGRANFALVAYATDQNGIIRAELAITGSTAKLAFLELATQRIEIDAAYGPGLDWDDMPERKQTRISETRYDVDIWNESAWPEQHLWLAERLEKLYAIFHDRVRALELDATSDEV